MTPRTHGHPTGTGPSVSALQAPLSADPGDVTGLAPARGTASRDTAPLAAPVIDVATITPAQGFLIIGDQDLDRAGTSVSDAGDVNGDGIDDFIVGAPDGDDGGNGAGEAYVIYGVAGSDRGTLDLSEITTSVGFVIQGDVALDRTGTSVSSAGDVNGDGIDDVIVGAPYADPNGTSSGAAYVVYGQTGTDRTTVDLTDLAASDGFAILGIEADDFAGLTVSSAGDMNGDGIDDVIVGSALQYEFSVGDGEAYVIYGQQGDTRGTIDLGTLDASDGFVILGPTRGNAGEVSAAGDVNGDGLADVIIGASTDDLGGRGSGSAYVVYGVAGTSRGTIDLDALSASDGFVIIGGEQSGALGVGVSSAGDVNGDGIDDLIVGAPGVDGDADRSGAAYVIYGQAEPTRQTLDLTDLSTSDGYMIAGSGLGTTAGTSVSGAGDVNGDGIDDVIVGTQTGTAYVVYGTSGSDRGTVDLATLSASEGFVIQAQTVDGDPSRQVVSAAGDVNGDGFDDLIVGTYISIMFTGDTGSAHVVYGFALGPPSATGLPESVVVAEDQETPLDLSGLVLFDGDQTGDMTVVLSAGAGTVSAANAGGVTADVTGAGRTLTLTGTLAELNAYLALPGVISYLGAPDANGTDSLTVTLNDQDGSGDVVVGTVTVSIAAVNDAPTLATPLEDQAVRAGLAVSFGLPQDAFADVDGDGLTLSAGLAGGDPLPDWLGFDPATGVFDGTPPESVAGSLTIEVTASDGTLTVSDSFDLFVAAGPGDPSDPPVTRAVGGGGATLQGAGGEDRLSAASGDNIIDGSGGADVLQGGFDDDRFFGGAGNDILIGDSSSFIAGRDVLEGGRGDDLLMGGGGADTFVFRTGDGADTIGAIALDHADFGASTVTGPDFVSGVDRIVLDGFALADGAAALALVSDVAGVATFAAEGTTITFAGLTTADLSASDFVI